MKYIRRALVALFVLSISLVLTACSFPGVKKTTEKTTTEKNPSALDTNGHFKADRSYTFNFSSKVDGETINVSQRLSFDKDGGAVLTDLSDNSTSSYTYKVENGMITCTDSKSLNDYYYYFEDVIVSADVFLMPGTLDGVAVSQRGTGTLGYVAFLVLNKGDLPAVLANETTNTHKYYKLYKNGTISNSGSRLVYDQLGKFDTENEGRYITTLTVSSKTYPIVVYINE